MTSNTNKYLLISPCRDEAEYMRQTLDSVIAQTIKPSMWIIVDDGSTDQTPEILKKYAENYKFIKIVRLEDRGKRSVGPGVVEAFYAGYNEVNIDDFEYICKLDLDLKLPPKYFELLIQRFLDNPRIGTCSGKPYFYNKNKELISEKCGDENSVGMTKFYRVLCFKQIGGFVKQVMWDSIDCHRCRMLGWIACSWDETELRFIHLRPMGSSQKGIVTGRLRHGFGQYFMGTGLVYMTISSIYRISRPPIIIGGLSMWWGYVKSMIMKVDRLDDLDFRKFLRNYQWSCLFRGKSAATVRLNNQRARFWISREIGTSYSKWTIT